MENKNIIASQTNAARLAGYMYLLGMAASIFVELYARGSLMVRGNAVETARNITAHETQFRTAIAFDLLTYLSVVLLAWALYILLTDVTQNLQFDVIASARDGMWEERSNPQNWEIASPHRTNPRWCSQRRFIILRKSSY